MAVGSRPIGTFAIVAQHAAVCEETNPIEQRLRRIDFAVDHTRLLSKVTRRVIQPRADILGGDAHIHFRITVAQWTRDGGIVGARFPA